MTTTAVTFWFLMALTGPRMDDGGPIAHPGSLANFKTKAECEKKALEIVKERTLPGQSTTYSCVERGIDPSAPASYGDDKTSKVYEVPVPLPEVFVVLINRPGSRARRPVLGASVSVAYQEGMPHRGL